MFDWLYRLLKPNPKEKDPTPLKRIGEMKNGDAGYTLEWALKYSPSLDLVIHPMFPLYEDDGNTLTLYVERKGGVLYVSEPLRDVAKQSGWSGSYRIPEDQFIKCIVLEN